MTFLSIPGKFFGFIKSHLASDLDNSITVFPACDKEEFTEFVTFHSYEHPYLFILLQYTHEFFIFAQVNIPDDKVIETVDSYIVIILCKYSYGIDVLINK